MSQYRDSFMLVEKEREKNVEEGIQIFRWREVKRSVSK